MNSRVVTTPQRDVLKAHATVLFFLLGTLPLWLAKPLTMCVCCCFSPPLRSRSLTPGPVLSRPPRPPARFDPMAQMTTSPREAVGPRVEEEEEEAEAAASALSADWSSEIGTLSDSNRALDSNTQHWTSFCLNPTCRNF